MSQAQNAWNGYELHSCSTISKFWTEILNIAPIAFVHEVKERRNESNANYEVIQQKQVVDINSVF